MPRKTKPHLRAGTQKHKQKLVLEKFLLRQQEKRRLALCILPKDEGNEDHICRLRDHPQTPTFR